MNMDYLSVAEEKIANTPVLVNLISYRTRQLNSGARPMVKKDHPEMDNHDLVLKEIAEGLLTGEMVNEIPETEVTGLDFDASNLPQSVRDALAEAATCHANQCYVAAAMLVRKTMEALCEDKQAAGGNLKDKIQSLGSKVVLPQQLLGSLDNLRLLGNDAAHIEARDYDDVGKEEVEVAFKVTKEILKAVYQYDDMVAALENLKGKK